MAERNGGITQEKFGGRVRHSAEVQTLNVCLFSDQVKLDKVPATSTFVDLVSNYDLVDMVHSVKTASGDSLPNYGGDLWVIQLQLPPQGLGQ
eukprot:14336370-Ditylum_brightwellii.AAC.1